MVNRNYEIDQGIDINSAVFNGKEQYLLSRYIKLYKMSLAYTFLLGIDNKGEFIQKFDKWQIDSIDKDFRTHIEDLIVVNTINSGEYALFDKVNTYYKNNIQNVRFKPQEPFFHHIIFFAECVYSDEKDARKKEHLIDYCVQQYKILNKNLFKKSILLFK